jgi:hypothetical protein
MGGVGSGGWRSRNRWRMTLEDLPSLDVVRWLRQGVLAPGTLFSQSLASPTGWCGNVGVLVVSTNVVRLVSSTAAEHTDLVCTEIALHWADCRLGGHRPWFACPGCARPCGKLYLHKNWKCRHCCALPYRSQTLTAADRCLHRAGKLRRKLQASKPHQRLRRSSQYCLLSEIAHLERQGWLLSLHAFLGLGEPQLD